jgi:cytochrome c biogenesis protein CcmG, thiol:disulfide interchange protein DsbE
VSEVAATPEGPTQARRLKPARWIAIGVFVVVAVLVVVLATRPAANSRVAGNPLVGSAAPNISGTALNGQPVNLQSLRGRWVVVNFFATWCVPCRQEHPELKKFSAEHQGADSPTIVAVAYDQNDLDAARSFFAQNGGNWPVVPDDGGRTAVAYGVRGLPESFIVDPTGKISSQITGGVTAAQLDNLTGQVA